MNSSTTNIYKTELKSVNDRSEKVQIIVQYDFSSLHSMTDGELIKLAEHLFSENLVWRDRSLIRDAAEAYASISDFSISCSGEYILCSRYWTQDY